jgi:hypothetical protein
MNTETYTVGTRPAALAAPPRAPSAVAQWWARLRADRERAGVLRESARALLWSRALVWLAGSGTLLALGYGPLRKAFDPPGLTRGFGWLGDLLAGPAARWDASWYMVIAQHGYRPDLGSATAARAAFFPLYPLLLAAISRLGAPPVLAGVLLSTGALALALYGIQRLTALELGDAGAARMAMLVTAFAPMAFYLSAVYSEALYLALSIGMFWYARQGRWALAGTLGGLAAATHSTGLLLVLPALMLYLYGPRADATADRPLCPTRSEPRLPGARLAGALHRLAPRYRLRRNVLWLALIPAGLLMFMGYLALSGASALLPFESQALWGRHFAGPYAGVWDGLVAALQGARQLLSFQTQHVYFAVGGASPRIAAAHNLLLLAFLFATIPALIGVLRRLAPAYGAYVIAALATPLSYPAAAQPLMSLPRFLLVLFPLSMWLGAWLAERPRAQGPLLAVSALCMAFFGAQFATWHWVA